MRNASGTNAELAFRKEARRKAGFLIRSASIFLLLALMAVAAFAQEKAKEEAKPAEAPPAGPATYVGSETCQACHEDIFKAFQKNPHAVVEKDKKKGWDGKACESCHGKGSKHAESTSAADIKNPAKMKAGKADERCLTCHLNSPTHIGRIEGGHARNQVACFSCHSVHKNPSAMVPRKAAAINDQCKTCHPSVWAQFQRPYKHKLPEGSMSCTDCHNPHGTFRTASTKMVSGGETGCFRCHGDKRGPFAFEHAPVRLEGCGACHEPHGSANPRMLTRSEARYLCLECHSNIVTPSGVTRGTIAVGIIPPAIHDLRNPRFRTCTTCHQKVHGSYVNRTLLR